MGFSKYHPPLLLIPLSLLLLPNLAISADFTTLIYKGCSGQPLPDSYQPVLTSLFDSLISQSSSAHFYKTTTGGGGGGGGVFGLFQCRGDLSAADCRNCVGQIPQTADRLCGRAAAARIQLTGCYGLYATGGPPGVSGTSMLFKTCSSNQAVGSGFEERRDTAFSNVQGGLAGGGGFYVTTYESVYAMGQCEGDLSVSDCGECVSAAVQKAEVECGSAIAGQVFLDKCYFSYSYYPNGVPRGGGGGGFGDDDGGDSHGSGQTGKTVAIVVGGAAALGFLVICLLFIRSLWKKRDDY
ncbi:Cysteine-rich repeat secretory protein 3 [Acorus gramineus]|uniref:Cysteine-rich repeat secretory protein 3 n=1 Tax=Acorus gramineus TaxID=55184 RepID=A0AAV9APW2_ACOGR|nr:Cysteine-rich repeat secretory protein 3 [Acorus gramineus]